MEIALVHYSSLTRRGHQPGKPEITELDDAELRDEDVLGLHVAVDDLKVSFSNEPIPIACPILLFSLFTSAFLPSFFLPKSLKSVDLFRFISHANQDF